MDWSTIGLTLSRLGLEGLGTALGGPLGGAIGKVVADQLGVPATPEAVKEAINGDPEIVKAKLADLESARQADLQHAKVDADDRANARAMQTAAPESSWTARMPTLVTVANWSLAVGVIVGVAFGWLREDGIIVGFGIGAYTASNNFWMGSSAGAKSQSNTMQAALGVAVGQAAKR